MDEMEKIVVETSRYDNEWNFYHQKQRPEGARISIDDYIYITSVPIPDGIGDDQKREIKDVLNGLCEVFTFVLNKK